MGTTKTACVFYLMKVEEANKLLGFKEFLYGEKWEEGYDKRRGI
jgi:hypothetical protein